MCVFNKLQQRWLWTTPCGICEGFEHPGLVSTVSYGGHMHPLGMHLLGKHLHQSCAEEGCIIHVLYIVNYSGNQALQAKVCNTAHDDVLKIQLGGA